MFFYRRIMKNDPLLEFSIVAIEKRIVFFETMIEDKSLLELKPVKKKKVNNTVDLTTRHPIYEWYRNIVYASLFGSSMVYTAFVDYVRENYITWSKGKEK